MELDAGTWGSEDAAFESEAEVAKRTLDTDIVERYVVNLDAAKPDEASFKAVVSALSADQGVKSAEWIAIAKGYAGRGKKIGSKKAALEAIQKRFVELVRAEANNRVAASARPW